MAQVHVIGRITADLELKYGQSGNPYVRFTLAENIGSKDRARAQYYQVWAWGDDATRLVSAKARKGSLICITGSLELEVYTRQDGITTDKRMKVSLNDWSFIPVNRCSGIENAPQDMSSSDPPPTFVDGIDGDRDSLPE